MQGYKRGTILQSGLVKLRDEEQPESDVYDRFRGRLMFPICNDVGEVIAFSGRILKARRRREIPELTGDTAFPQGQHPVRSAQIQAGLDRSKLRHCVRRPARSDQLFEAGLTNVVAPQGTAFTENQARILKRYADEVVLCFDSDAAGPKAAERSLDALLENDLVVRVVELPPGEDPDSLIPKERREKFGARIANARDFFDFWIEREVSTTVTFQSERKDAARPATGGDGRASARPVDAERSGQQSRRAPRCWDGGFRIAPAETAARAELPRRRRGPWRPCPAP